MKSVRCGAARHAATARRGLGGHGQVAPGAEHPAKKGPVTTKKGTASWEELVACSYMYVMHKSTSLITCHADLQRLAMTPTLAAHTPRRRRRERVMPAMCFCLRVVHVVVHFRRRQAGAAPARARDSSLRAPPTRPERSCWSPGMGLTTHYMLLHSGKHKSSVSSPHNQVHAGEAADDGIPCGHYFRTRGAPRETSGTEKSCSTPLAVGGRTGTGRVRRSQRAREFAHLRANPGLNCGALARCVL